MAPRIRPEVKLLPIPAGVSRTSSSTPTGWGATMAGVATRERASGTTERVAAMAHRANGVSTMGSTHLSSNWPRAREP
ncbi:hypothetical protein D3C75_939800 [compost metagenome]